MKCQLNSFNYVRILVCVHVFNSGEERRCTTVLCSVTMFIALIPVRPDHCGVYTVEPGYNDMCLCDTSSITLYIAWYKLISRC